MLAKNVNDNACILDKHGAFEFFASKLAPTVLAPKLSNLGAVQDGVLMRKSSNSVLTCCACST
ncbi:hypothetical protein SAMN05216202_2106 [Pseudomonas mucidolens]|uniref:Uncharacterized protein n=1 Tax=Pseudomonas mucidolens TaxID=46679 RepID=A0A1H2MPE6_9PSED|nr:hypothetical protein SAMN05216202_2106 [Pseudomonas mucidolens]SQH33495.1 Uncharacterised protein [Pseudomonas mucidolens]